MFMITVTTLLDDGAIHREYHLRAESETAADLAWQQVRVWGERRYATITPLVADRTRAFAQREGRA
jgi:hypothetical protein